MAKVKTFRINPEYGVPDKDIREWLTLCEQEGFINVATTFIPNIGSSDPRITVIVTKLDDYEDEVNGNVDLQATA